MTAKLYHSIQELRDLAHRRVPKIAFDYLEGGAGSEGESGHLLALKEDSLDHQDTPAPRNRLEFGVISLNVMKAMDDAQREALMTGARNLVGMYGSSFNPLRAKSWQSNDPKKKPDGIQITGVNDRSAQSMYLEIKKLVSAEKLQFKIV